MANILCFSRSYLAYLMPEFSRRDTSNKYYFIAQTNKEENVIKSKGGEVVINIERYIKNHLNHSSQDVWIEPSDFRKVTNFGFSPIYSDRYLINFSSERRPVIAGGLFKGFNEIFKNYKIDYLIGEPVAIFSTHLLMYLTIKNGGKPRLWSSTFFPDHFFFSENVRMSEAVPKKVQMSEQQLGEKKEFIRSYLHGIIEDKTGPAYHFSFAKKRSVLDTFLKTRQGNSPIVVMPGIVSIVLQFLRYTRAKAYSLLFPLIGDFQTAASAKEHWFYLQCLTTSKSYYDAMPENYDVDALMYPVQYEPEATLLYFSPDFSDQVVVVENILKSLPHDKILYVKEHPNQFGALGLSRWRSLRKKYHNVRFIYGRLSGRDLIKKCNLITCISSSAGMDALLLGKKVILVGDVYYQKFSGAHKVFSYDELNKVLNMRSTYEYKGHDYSDNVDDFMELAERSYLGFPYSSQSLFEEENLQNIVNALKTELV